MIMWLRERGVPLETGYFSTCYFPFNDRDTNINFLFLISFSKKNNRLLTLAQCFLQRPASWCFTYIICIPLGSVGYSSSQAYPVSNPPKSPVATKQQLKRKRGLGFN